MSSSSDYDKERNTVKKQNNKQQKAKPYKIANEIKTKDHGHMCIDQTQIGSILHK